MAYGETYKETRERLGERLRGIYAAHPSAQAEAAREHRLKTSPIVALKRKHSEERVAMRDRHVSERAQLNRKHEVENNRFTPHGGGGIYKPDRLERDEERERADLSDRQKKELKEISERQKKEIEAAERRR
jgi:hypothetical protein